MTVIKKNLFYVPYAITDYDTASDLIIEKAVSRSGYGVGALAVHGAIESIRNAAFRENLKKLDLIVPDGQPIKWALNSFHKAGLQERVAGPVLTLHVLKKANEKSLKIFLYGSKPDTLTKMKAFINTHYPNVVICGIHPDRFREATPEENEEDITQIKQSGAQLILVGRGCPRQEKWVADHIDRIDAPMMAVGAAFDFCAGTVKRAPVWMQKSGLEWLHRLAHDPKRLWKRYLVTNSYFIYLVLMCKMGFKKISL